HAHRGLVPFAVLGVTRMGGMVGRDDVDGAVGEALAHRGDVLGGAQRRVDLEDGVELAHVLVGQQQVVRGDLGGHGDAALLGPADDVDAAGGGQVAHVQAGADVLGQEHV